MRIALITGLLNPSAGGGACVSIQQLSKRLAKKKDTHVSVLCGDDTQIEGVDCVQVANFRRISFSVQQSLKFTQIIANFRQAVALRKYSKRMNAIIAQHEYDIVDAHGPWTDMADMVTVRYCIKAYFDKCSSAEYPSGVKGVLCRMLDFRMRTLLNLEKKQFNTSKAYVAVSEKVRGELAEYYGITKNVFVVENAIDTREYTRSSPKKINSFKRQHNIDGKTVYTWVGANAERKQLPLVLQALESVNIQDVVLIVAGIRDIDSYLSLAPKIKKQVIHIPWADDMATLFGASNVFVFPTLYDACAKVVIEAMAAKNLVVTTAESGCGHVLEDNKNCVLLHKGTLEELSGIIQKYHSDTKTREQLAKSAQKKALRNNWSDTSKAFHHIYNQLYAERVKS